MYSVIGIVFGIRFEYQCVFDTASNEVFIFNCIRVHQYLISLQVQWTTGNDRKLQKKHFVNERVTHAGYFFSCVVTVLIKLLSICWYESLRESSPIVSVLFHFSLYFSVFPRIHQDEWMGPKRALMMNFFITVMILPLMADYSRVGKARAQMRIYETRNA